MLRVLARDIKDYPATMTLGALWVVVFLLMILTGLLHGQITSLGQVLFVGLGGNRRFGDLTLHDLFGGEVWRTLTCTFVHYGVLHIGINLWGLYQLGCLVESWYGPTLFLAIYVLIGSGGNLLSGLVRHGLGSDPSVHSGGGSTVLMGLVALCAVVGWRARTRIGDYLHRQMVWILVATALLGVIILAVTALQGQMRPIIDNWGHAGGAAAGALIGLAHRVLVRASKRPIAWWAGAVAALLLVASGAAQVRQDRLEDRQRVAFLRWKAAEQAAGILRHVGDFYIRAAQRSAFEHSAFVPRSYLHAPGTMQPILRLTDTEFHKELRRYLEALDVAQVDLGTAPDPDDFQWVRRLLTRVPTRPPTAAEFYEFRSHLEALYRRSQQDQDAARAQFEALIRQS